MNWYDDINRTVQKTTPTTPITGGTKWYDEINSSVTKFKVQPQPVQQPVQPTQQPVQQPIQQPVQQPVQNIVQRVGSFISNMFKAPGEIISGAVSAVKSEGLLGALANPKPEGMSEQQKSENLQKWVELKTQTPETKVSEPYIKTVLATATAIKGVVNKNVLDEADTKLLQEKGYFDENGEIKKGKTALETALRVADVAIFFPQLFTPASILARGLSGGKVIRILGKSVSLAKVVEGAVVMGTYNTLYTPNLDRIFTDKDVAGDAGKRFVVGVGIGSLISVPLELIKNPTRALSTQVFVKTAEGSGFANINDLKKVYMSLAKKYHPDSLISGNKEAFVAIKNKYNNLDIDWLKKLDFATPQEAEKILNIKLGAKIPTPEVKVQPKSLRKSTEEIKPNVGEMTPKGKALDPLVQEARKYKSAEEFIKNKIYLDKSLSGELNTFKSPNGYLKFQKEGGGVITLENMEVSEKARGMGEAKKLMDKFIEYVDRGGDEVGLYAYPQDDLTHLDRLKKFYERYGFEVVGDFGESGADMIRKPQTPKSGAVQTKSQLTDIYNQSKLPQTKIKPQSEIAKANARSTPLYSGSLIPSGKPEIDIQVKTASEMIGRKFGISPQTVFDWSKKTNTDLRPIISQKTGRYFDTNSPDSERLLASIISDTKLKPQTPKVEPKVGGVLYDIKSFAGGTGLKGKELETAWKDFSKFVAETPYKSEAFEAWNAKYPYRVGGIEVKPKLVSVPREQIPVGTGKEKASRLEARVTESLDKTPQEIKDQLGATFNQMNKAEQKAMAVKYVLEKPEEAMQVLMGQREAPKGMLRNSIYVAMENLAKDDVGLARKLASLGATRAGQELSILTEIDPDSPVKIIRDVIKIREEAFKKRSGLSPNKAKDNIVREIKSKIKVPSKWDWNEFIKSIEC